MGKREPVKKTKEEIQAIGMPKSAKSKGERVQGTNARGSKVKDKNSEAKVKKSSQEDNDRGEMILGGEAANTLKNPPVTNMPGIFPGQELLPALVDEQSQSPPIAAESKPSDEPLAKVSHDNDQFDSLPDEVEFEIIPEYEEDDETLEYLGFHQWEYNELST